MGGPRVGLRRARRPLQRAPPRTVRNGVLPLRDLHVGIGNNRLEHARVLLEPLHDLSALEGPLAGYPYVDVSCEAFATDAIVPAGAEAGGEHGLNVRANGDELVPGQVIRAGCAAEED